MIFIEVKDYEVEVSRGLFGDMWEIESARRWWVRQLKIETDH